MAAPMGYFTAIKILVSPPSKSVDPQTESAIDDATRFDLSLKTTLQKLHAAIESDKKCRDLSTALGAKMTDWKDSIAVGQDIRWLYSEHCLALLCGLKDAVRRQMVEFSEEQRRRKAKKLGPHEAPPLAPDTFSIGQQRDLATVLQFIVCLGLVPNLLHGIGIPMEKRSGFGQLLASGRRAPDARRLERVARGLLDCIGQPSLGGLILTRHLGDLLAALLQICHLRAHRASTHLRDRGSPDSADAEAEASLKPLFDNPGAIRLPSEAVSGETRSLNSETTVRLSLKTDSRNLEKPLPASSEDPATAEPRTESSDPDGDQFFQDSLSRLLKRAFQPMVIRELLFLQGGPGTQGGQRSGKEGAGSASRCNTSQNPLPQAPPWLRKECGRLLTERLMQPKGVQWVLRGLLDIGGAMAGASAASSSPDWRKCDAVARLISDCPLQGQSAEVYYQKVCPQILELLHFKDQSLLKQVLRVAGSCVVAMASQHPQLAEVHLIRPMLAPLHTMLHGCDGEVKAEGAPSVLVDEATLSQCIEGLRSIFVGCTESVSCLVGALEAVVHPLFELLCFAKQGVCNLRSALEDILHTFFHNVDKKVALGCLKQLAFLESDPRGGEVKRVQPGVQIAPGSLGGAVVMLRPDIRADELFTEGLMSQEQTAATVLELLTRLRKEGLAGDFFIIVLKELTSITSSKPPDSGGRRSDPGSGGSSGALLDVEEEEEEEERGCRVAHLQHSLQVLAVLSRLCQDLGPAVLEDTSQTLAFVQATLDRAASSLDRRGETFDVFETETLSLAFGLVSAVLSGDLEKKVSSEHRQSLMLLLPSLERISREHPLEPLQRMATDLRIAIATHGAVWTESMREATEKLKSSVIADGSRAGEERKESGRDTRQQTERAAEQKPTPDESTAGSPQTDARNSSATTTGTPHVGLTSEDMQSSRAPSVTSDESKSQAETTDGAEAASQDFDEAFRELFDPLLPVRGHALRVLGKLLLAGDPKALQKGDMLVGIFQENLAHEDSYIYLSAIQALSCIADVFPQRVIPHLCQEFVSCQKEREGRRMTRTTETRVKLGEALVRATKSLGELVPRYGNVLLGAFLQGAQDPDPIVRASSLSNMAEVCKLLRFSLGPNLHEVLHCLMVVLKSDPKEQVRRACVLVLTLLLRGLGKDAIQVLETVLRDIYRSLKLALAVEKDDVVRLHCQLALEELDSITRQYLFPEQTLTKKITVLP